MGIPVMIMGESGTGKTCSLRDFNPDEVLLIQAVNKPLPFKNKFKPWDSVAKKGSIFVTDKSNKICKIIASAPSYGKKIIVIDDYQYTMANEFMRRVLDKETGNAAFAKFNEIARWAWDIVMAAQSAPADIRVYFLTHCVTNDMGETRTKTIGKMLDEKITLEGLFTIVMRSMKTQDGYKFSTQNSGTDTVKTPMGLFDSDLIDNNLADIDRAITQYYEIGA
jgi:hypothetical protein